MAARSSTTSVRRRNYPLRVTDEPAAAAELASLPFSTVLYASHGSIVIKKRPADLGKSHRKEMHMQTKHLVLVGCAVVVSAVPALMAFSHSEERNGQPTGIVREVRQSTREFLDVDAAGLAGYNSTGSCVSGPQAGAMGVHYVNGTLFGDDALEASSPEILVYEPRGGKLRLVAVEYVVDAALWDAKKIGPPILMGQHFHYVGSPNRYGGGAFYELHVWAWKNNPSGTFADWNPNVSCDEYAGESSGSAVHSMHH
jgi:hypothetical protein